MPSDEPNAMNLIKAPLKAFVIEDSPVIRQNLVSTLQELAPVNVVGAVESQREALEQLTDPGLDCDLVIVDIVLKDGTGFGVLADPAVRRDGRRFIVLSNYASSAIRRRCAELGVERVFDKSNEIEDLLDYCQRLALDRAH
jgi:two-component system, OmpR family, response regulator